MLPPSSTLFIVPWLAAPTRSGCACASAARHTSATRWLTSTLPAPTATGGTAATTVPGGAITCTGRIVPPLAGSVGSVTARIANATALTVTASTAFTLPGRCASVPVKSNVTSSPLDAHLDDDPRRRLLFRARAGGVEHVVGDEASVGEVAERGAHAPFAVVEDLGERGDARHHRARAR